MNYRNVHKISFKQSLFFILLVFLQFLKKKIDLGLTRLLLLLNLNFLRYGLWSRKSSSSGFKIVAVFAV